MKKINFLPLLIFVAFASVFVSCKKDVEDRIPGNWFAKWNFNVVEDYTDSTGTSSETHNETLLSEFTFDEDGTGSFTFEGETNIFTWTAKEKTISITMTEDGQSETLDFDIVINEKDEQIWKGTISEEYNYGSAVYKYVSNIQITLTRKEK